MTLDSGKGMQMALSVVPASRPRSGQQRARSGQTWPIWNSSPLTDGRSLDGGLWAWRRNASVLPAERSRRDWGCARVTCDAFGDHLGRGTGGERGSGPCLQGPRGFELAEDQLP